MLPPSPSSSRRALSLRTSPSARSARVVSSSARVASLLCAALSLQATGAVLLVAQKPGRRHRVPEPQLPVIPPEVQVERVAV